MDKEFLKGHWQEARGQVKKYWAKVTDEELDSVKGNFDGIAKLLQHKYGYSRDKAKDQLRQKLSMIQ